MDSARDESLFRLYPEGWPACYFCGRPVLTDHLTCGSVDCSELQARIEKEAHWRCGRLFNDLPGAYEY